MAMSLDTAIKFTAKLEGKGLDQLKRGLQGMAQQANRSSKDLDQLYNANKRLAAASGQSINSLNRQVQVLTNLRNEAALGSRQFKFYSAELEKLQRQQARVTGAASPQGGLLAGIGGLRGGIAAAAAFVGTAGATQLIGGIARAGMDAETARVRLKALTDTYGEYNEAQQLTARIASTLRITNTEATDSFAKLYAGLRPTGVSMKELEQIFVGFNVAARTSGATAEETSAAMIQLKQALVSGRAQGDELRSILEQAPALGQAVAEQMTKLGTFGKVTRAQLKDLGAEGKISTDVLIAALRQLGEQELPKLESSFNTGAQAVTDLKNAANELQVQLAEAFGPIALDLIKGFTAVVNGAADAMERFNRSRMDRGQQIATNEQAFRNAAKQLYGDETMGGLISFLNSDFRALYEQERQRLISEANVAAQQKKTEQQLDAVKQANQEREATRDAANADKRKKSLDDELKIRLDTERKLADFREQSVKRALELERDLGDQRLELERSTAEARRRIQQQDEDRALERARQQLRAQGLGTDALETQARLNEATRRFTEQKIQIEQNATDKKVQLERTLEQYKLSVADGIRNILVDAAEKMADKMKEGGRAAAAAVSGGSTGGMSTGIIARTGNTGQSTGPHLDARWADGRRISAADVDRFLLVNGRAPSSFGVTSPYGPRNLFGRNFHSGIDFGTPAGSGISLQNGAKVLRDLGFTGAGGYAVEIDTPQGRMRLLHLQGGSVARAGASAPAAASAVDMSGVNRAAAALSQAQGANTAAQTQSALGDLIGSRQAELGNITSALDQQRQAVRQQREDFERMVELQRSGLSPELAQQVLDRERMAVAETTSLQVLEQQLVKDLQLSGLTDKQRTDLEAMLTAVRGRIEAQPQVLAGLAAEEQALDRMKTNYEQKKELVQGIANSIGSGIGSALDLLIEGTDNWGNSLREIGATVLKDIARQILQIMVIAPIVKGITKAFGFANGGIMTGDGPVPLKKYAAGGIARSPQLALFGEGSRPEAYVPLPDGRRIPVAMKGGGGGNTTVNVSVDAKGTSVQGNGGQSEQLGRAVAQAVQQELIRQKRPGGLIAA